MARLVGVDLPKEKQILYALTYIYGVGLKISEKILTEAGIDFTTKTKDLSEAEIVKIRDVLRTYVTEGDLRRSNGQNIKRLMEIGTYRGQRHKRKLPVRGQRTHTNARTRKGKSVAIAGKKKVTK